MGQSESLKVQRTAKRSTLGIISLILGIMTMLAAGVGEYATLLFGRSALPGGGDFGGTVWLYAIVCAQSIVGLFALSGLILGILALVKRESRKGFAIAGITLSPILLCLSLVLAVTQILRL